MPRLFNAKPFGEWTLTFPQKAASKNVNALIPYLDRSPPSRYHDPFQCYAVATFWIRSSIHKTVGTGLSQISQSGRL